MTSETEEPINEQAQVPKEETQEQEEWYLALRNLAIPNGQGTLPSSIRVDKGVRFQLDGDEPIHVDRLLNSGAFKLYVEGTDDDLLIDSEKQMRREAAAKPRMRSVKTPRKPGTVRG